MDEVAHAAFECASELGEGLEGDVTLSPFDIADIIAGKAGAFPEFLLSEFCASAPGADGLPNDSVNVSRCRMHSGTWKQKGRGGLPTGSWYLGD